MSHSQFITDALVTAAEDAFVNSPGKYSRSSGDEPDFFKPVVEAIFNHPDLEKYVQHRIAEHEKNSAIPQGMIEHGDLVAVIKTNHKYGKCISFNTFGAIAEFQKFFNSN